MKTHIILFKVTLFFFITIFINEKGYSQSSSAFLGNTIGGPNEYIGWASGTGLALDIKNEDDQPLFFYTNAGAAAYANRKMTIWRRTLNGVEHAAVSIHSTNGSNITLPRSILHLGNNSVAGIAGWRNWMDIGTFYGDGSDFAYMGTMERVGDSTIIGGDHNDAVIVWGDNINAPDGADNFRILFSSPLGQGGTGTAGTYNTLEVSRYSPLGRVGIGNFSITANGGGSGIQPLRRLEIYGENNDTLLNAAAPQLRLTHTPNANVNLGINTDFQSMNTGDLFINPRNAGNNRFVGINTTTPGNTLEINSNSTYSAGAIGNSGLIFSDLRSGSGTSAGNGKVLTVDNNGEVILVPDNDGGSITACSSPGLTTNYITKATASTQICLSQVYDDGTSVGVGVGASPNTAMKLHMQGDMYLQHNMGTGTPKGGDLFMNDASGNVERILSMYGTGGFGAISLGHFAGNSQTLGSGSGAIANSVFVGREAGRNVNANSSHNTLIGSEAGENISASTGNSNSIMGSAAVQNLTDGEKNVVIGAAAGNGISPDFLLDGDFNVFIGAEVQNNTALLLTRNVVIGTNASVKNDASTTLASDRTVVVGFGALAQDNLGTVDPDVITYSGVFGASANVACDSCIAVGANSIHRIGIGIASPSRTTMLDVNPRATHTFSAVFRGASIQVNGVTVLSDQDLKENITPLPNVSDDLAQLSVYSYNYKNEDYPQVGLDDQPHFGFMAQEVETLFPDLITNFTTDPAFDSLGVETHPSIDTKGIRYLEFIPLLLQGFKEQKTIVDDLQQQIIDLTQQLNSCCAQPLINNGENPNSKASLVLSNKETIILNQNAPNPFKDKTEIGYNIPESVGDAVILFYDQSGRVLQKFEINHRGAGSLTVYGEDLSSGAYTYSLIIDGENHQTKRMVKQ